MASPPDPTESPSGVDAPKGAKRAHHFSAIERSEQKLSRVVVNLGADAASMMRKVSVDGFPGCAASAALPGPSAETPFSPWYSPHTGTLQQEFMKGNALRKGHFRVKIYPFGVKLEGKLGVGAVSAEDMPEVKRGAIDDFSAEAARRLREAFISLHVPGFDLWAFTLTTHQTFTPSEWREISKRFRTAVKRKGWAGIWRVELQKRKTPHDHVAFWLPPGVGHADVKELWLTATREERDPAARAHAVVSQRIAHDDTGWAVYMGMHNGKHKEEQLGWIGKQWGIWNAELLVEREFEDGELNPREHARFLRVLRKLEASRKQTHLLSLWAAARAGVGAESVSALKAAVAIEKREGVKTFGVGVRISERPLHRGNLLRCVDGRSVSRILAWAKDKPGEGAGSRGDPKQATESGQRHYVVAGPPP